MTPAFVCPMGVLSGNRLFARPVLALILFTSLLLPAIASEVDRQYYAIAIEQLPLEKRTEFGAAPFRQNLRYSGIADSTQAQVFPYVRADGAEEVYVAPGADSPSDWVDAKDLVVAISSIPGEKVRGILFYPLAESGEKFARFPFELTPQMAGAEREEFLQIKANHYKRLAGAGIPGSAWFRHQSREAASAEPPEPVETRQHNWRGSELERTFALFSGGRAIAENLALDESLSLVPADDEPVHPVSEIRGISIQEYDWVGMSGDTPVTTDYFARLIPSNQHALFFRDASAVNRFIREWQEKGLPIFEMFKPASVPSGLVARYEHQFGISFSELEQAAAELGLGEIAITGGDPYFATGTDVAILIETANPEELVTWMERKFRAIADREADVRFSRSADADVRPVLSMTNPIRDRSAHVAAYENAVLLSNSTAQIDAIERIFKGEKPSIASLDEYRFFRARYPKTDEQETAFLLLTDDTIRRWNGPEWRIAASRRLRAAAFLADQTARNLASLVDGEVPHTRSSSQKGGNFEDLIWSALGPRSEKHGHLGFLTPISELRIDSATQAEVRAYEHWRDRYERDWEGYFDPIAIRFSGGPDRLDAELSVMPLTASSEYRRFMEFAGDMEIHTGSGDPREDALLQVALAADIQSRMMGTVAEMLGMYEEDFDYHPLSWMKGTVSVYLDDDLFWRALPHIPNPGTFVAENFADLPAALHVDSTSSARLAVFLSRIRTLIEKSAPEIMRWETRHHNGQPYVAVYSDESGDSGPPTRGDFVVFYTARSDALVVSLNEDVIHRSIDRYLERRDGGGANMPWLGKQINLSLPKRSVRILEAIFREHYEARKIANTCAPIPLLNDWRMRFPHHDPIHILRTHWHLDPGDLVWNDEFKTYESDRFGSEATPRSDREKPSLLPDFSNLRLGVTFEHDGIRMRGILDRSIPETASRTQAVPDDTAAIETARYAPLQKGAMWIWKEGFVHSEGDPQRMERVADIVSTDKGERILIEGTTDFWSEPEPYRAWYSDTDGIRFHRSESENQTVFLTAPEVILPPLMYPNRPYPFQSDGSITADGDSETIHKMGEIILEGFDTIEVEAGRFENCIRIRSKTVATQGNFSSLTHRVTWFAPGVGKVKSEWTVGSDRTVSELLSYRVAAVPAGSPKKRNQVDKQGR